MRLFATAALVATFVLGWSAGAFANSIGLSQASSDQTPAGVLDAVVTFTITGGDTLSLKLDNTTAHPDAYTISELYFNGSALVSGLSAPTTDDSTSWSLSTNMPADGFGTFDYLLTAASNDPDAVQTSESIIFTMTISGTCANDSSCTWQDFLGGSYLGETFSTVPPGEFGTQVAAKFVQGPAINDPGEEIEDSAFGASNDEGFPPVPEPTTLALVGLGLMGLVAFGRRGSQGHR
jgi:hypothetical protein